MNVTFLQGEHSVDSHFWKRLVPLMMGLQIHFRGVVNDLLKDMLKSSYLGCPSKKSPSAWGLWIENGMAQYKAHPA